jgi:hypothetical protein
MADSSLKPKRVLTEAQRLAFLKGREKRMANIEKKRLEKLEAEQAEYKKEFTPPAEPPVKTNTETPPPPAPAPVVVPPTPPKLKRESTIVNPVIDEEKIASRVAEEVLRKIEENKPKRKPRTSRPRPVAVPDDEPKIVHNFSWL